MFKPQGKMFKPQGKMLKPHIKIFIPQAKMHWIVKVQNTKKTRHDMTLRHYQSGSFPKPRCEKRLLP